jgi:hypothetical protein
MRAYNILMGNLLLTHFKNECKQQNKRYEKERFMSAAYEIHSFRVHFVDVIGYCLVDIMSAQASQRIGKLFTGNFEPLFIVNEMRFNVKLFKFSREVSLESNGSVTEFDREVGTKKSEKSIQKVESHSHLLMD